jgi:drug/metabolite transporter (DMT)-like permease
VRRPVVVLAYSTAALGLATQWIAAKIALASAPPLELSTMRFAIASAVLVGLAVATRTPLPLRRWRPIGAAAALGFFGFNSLAFLGLRLTPASDSALIVPTTIPLATALLATFIREPLTRRKLVGFAVASIGAAIVIAGGQQAGAELSTSRLLGNLLELASAVAWAACLTVAAIVLRTEGVLGFFTLASLLGTAMLFPLGFLEHGYRDLGSWSSEAWTASVVLGVLSTVVPILIFFWAVRRFGAGLGAMISYLVPLAALILAFVVLGERPLPLQVLGAVVILLGVRSATAGARDRPPRPRPPGAHDLT